MRILMQRTLPNGRGSVMSVHAPNGAATVWERPCRPILRTLIVLTVLAASTHAAELPARLPSRGWVVLIDEA